MTLDQETINSILLLFITGTGAVVTATWLGLILWTWRDMRLRSRDPLAQIAASLMVAVLGIYRKPMTPTTIPCPTTSRPPWTKS